MVSLSPLVTWLVSSHAERDGAILLPLLAGHE